VSISEVNFDHKIRIDKLNGQLKAEDVNAKKSTPNNKGSKKSNKFQSLLATNKKFLGQLKGVGCIIFLANLIHKVADGLVIGAGNNTNI
jgi:zinc transporter ZupT